MIQNLWGLDLGGTKVEGVILNSALNPEILFRERIPTEAERGYDHIVSQIEALVNKMKTFAGYMPDTIGMATPGTLDPILGTMKNCNSTNLNGQPLKDDLEKRLGIKILIANDANCFALAEARMGAVKDQFPQARVVFGVIMGTGVGGGVVVDGNVINGLQGIGGEWGHNFLDDSGGPCYCGKNGCVEKILSGPALQKYYLDISGKPATMKEIYQKYMEGKDEHAKATINRLTHMFGLAISVVVNILDPDVIVIGGGVGNIDPLYTDGRVSLKKYVFNNRLDTSIIKPKLGDSAGVFGAAYLS